MKYYALLISLLSVSFSSLAQFKEISNNHSNLPKEVLVEFNKTSNKLGSSSRQMDESTFKLDSVIGLSLVSGTADEFENFFRRTYSYEGNDKTNLTSMWDNSTESWENSSKYNRTDTDLGSEYESWTWNNSSQVWEENIKFSYVDNEDGQETFYEYYSHQDDDWVGYTKYTNDYNEDGLKQLYTNYEWNADIGDWELSEKINYSYDDNKLLIKEEKSIPTGVDNGWRTTLRTEHSYNESNQILKDSIYADRGPDNSLVLWSIIKYYQNSETLVESDTTWVKWDYLAEDFEFNLVHIHEYDENGNQINNEYYKWDDVLEEWNISSYSETKFDTNGNRTFTENIYYSEFSESGSRYEYKFDSENREIEEIFYVWDSDLNDWYGVNKILTTYGSHGLEKEDTYTWDTEIGEWFLSGINTYYYSEHVEILDVDDSLLPLVWQIAPNPTSNNFRLISKGQQNIKAVTIFDLKGQKVRGFDEFKSQYSLAGLTPGIYSVIIQSNEGIYRQKLAIE